MKRINGLRQAGGLFFKRSRRRGRLFDQRRVLLRNLVHLRNRLTDLNNTATLLIRAAAISSIISVTRLTASTISFMVLPAAITSSDPCSIRLTDAPIKPSISFAACALRLARVRTSLATTAKPRPCSPARAASTAAFSARMLVWKAILLMTAVISEIFSSWWKYSPSFVRPRKPSGLRDWLYRKHLPLVCWRDVHYPHSV